MVGALQLSDWAAVAGIAAAAGTFGGLLMVAFQLHVANRERQAQVRSQRSQATMVFQGVFKESSPARIKLFRNFPIHASLVPTINSVHPGGCPNDQIAIWDSVDDLSGEQVECAKEVVKALNDVAQYVVDGLELRSALQQYHLVMLRAGLLLNPFLEEENAEVAGRKRLRWGRRVPILYNAALAYHRCNPKHSGRPVVLTRPKMNEEGDLELIFFDGHDDGAQQFECFADTPRESLVLPDDELPEVITAAEAKLRQ